MQTNRILLEAVVRRRDAAPPARENRLLPEMESDPGPPDSRESTVHFRERANRPAAGEQRDLAAAQRQQLRPRDADRPPRVVGHRLGAAPAPPAVRRRREDARLVTVRAERPVGAPVAAVGAGDRDQPPGDRRQRRFVRALFRVGDVPRAEDRREVAPHEPVRGVEQHHREVAGAAPAGAAPELDDHQRQQPAAGTDERGVAAVDAEVTRRAREADERRVRRRLRQRHAPGRRVEGESVARGGVERAARGRDKPVDDARAALVAARASHRSGPTAGKEKAPPEHHCHSEKQTEAPPEHHAGSWQKTEAPPEHHGRPAGNRQGRCPSIIAGTRLGQKRRPSIIAGQRNWGKCCPSITGICESRDRKAQPEHRIVLRAARASPTGLGRERRPRAVDGEALERVRRAAVPVRVPGEPVVRRQAGGAPRAAPVAGDDDGAVRAGDDVRAAFRKGEISDKAAIFQTRLRDFRQGCEISDKAARSQARMSRTLTSPACFWVEGVHRVGAATSN
eukprot:gene7247-biopygen11418